MPAHIQAKATRKTKPSTNSPVASLTMPSSNGGKKPPRPPAAPTIPVAAPVAFGKNSGTCLNTAPLPRPRKTAIVRQKIVTGTIDGSEACQERPIASTPIPMKTSTSTLRAADPIGEQPPTGRAAVANRVNPAARSPASVSERSNQSVSSFGRNSAIATKPPKVTK